MTMLEIIVVAALILLNGYLAMCELAIVSSRRSHPQRLAGGGHRGAHAALTLVNDPARFLASLQIGITGRAICVSKPEAKAALIATAAKSVSSKTKDS